MRHVTVYLQWFSCFYILRLLPALYDTWAIYSLPKFNFFKSIKKQMLYNSMYVKFGSHATAPPPPHSFYTFTFLQLQGCGLVSLVWFLSSSEEQSDELYRKLSPSSSSLSLKSRILPFFDPVLWWSACSSPSDFSWPLLVPFCFSASWAACSLAFLLLFHFMRLFWNQILTWRGKII